MDVTQLRSFRSVVAAGSVRAAADALGYSPSAVSQQLATLQRQVGVTLLSRVGRGLEPTEAGWALAEQVDSMLGELGALDDFVRGLREGRSAALHLAYFHSLGTSWLPQIVGPLLTEHPDVQLDLHIADAFEAGRRPRPDLQLVVAPPGLEPPPGYDLVHLVDDAYVVALPAAHGAALQEGALCLRDLADEEWVDNDVAKGWCRQVVLDACAAVGMRPRFRVEAHDYPSALALVAAGLGVSVMPSLGAQDLPPGVVTRPLARPTPVRRIGILVLRESMSSPVARRALELARSVASPAGLAP